jgi:hypothetical protein
MIEHQEALSIGPLMKAARKFKKLNQSEVAEAIGCSQSALSKMEHDLLTPSATQWFLFSRFTAIPPEAIESGVIDRHSKVKFNNDQVSLGFKIPKKYRLYRGGKVREIYPFLEYLEKRVHPPLRQKFIEMTGLDTEFFLDFDNLISFQLFLDTISFFIQHDLASPHEIESLVKFGQDKVFWDRFNLTAFKADSVKAVLEAFAREQIYFQSDFQIQCETISGQLTLTYFPEPHLKQMNIPSPDDVMRFLNHYRKVTIEELIARALGVKVEAQLLPPISSSFLSARFEIRAV